MHQKPKHFHTMLIGRIEEQSTLRQAYESEYSEFVAIYGRRRVGKTFLVRETFDYQFTFYHSGLSQKNTRVQLQNFQLSLREQGMPKAPLPENWLQAFSLLAKLLSQSTDEKKVVFIDELPWLDAPRSGFLAAFEHFWNSWASARKDILLIICGSATAWIINKIINNHGGLHNRVTSTISLQPFTLHECDEYAKSLHLEMNHRQVLEGYMVMGGVPYYWSRLKRGKSLLQNIDRLFFGRNGELRNEFSQLYASLFTHPEPYLAVIDILSTKKAGMTRNEIIEEGNIPDNGKLKTVLEDLENCGFIRKYYYPERKAKGSTFQLIDNYTLFYYQFIKDSKVNDEQYWTKMQDTPEYNTWCGLAFERVCLLHSQQIKRKLGISGVISNEYAWRLEANEEHPGTQIDLLIDRSDDVVNLCEMKYTKQSYLLTRAYSDALQMKKQLFSLFAKSPKAIHLTMVTSCGLIRNSYADEIPCQVTAEDLFCE